MLAEYSLLSETPLELRHYLTSAGRDPFQEWLDALRDTVGRSVVLRRLDRLSGGNLGDCRPCREGVWELRIDFGPGYRVYYAIDSTTTVLLLFGGSKCGQAADIETAVRYWRNYRRRRRT
jgi:putative addiction module killer protein